MRAVRVSFRALVAVALVAVAAVACARARAPDGSVADSAAGGATGGGAGGATGGAAGGSAGGATGGAADRPAESRPDAAAERVPIALKPYPDEVLADRPRAYYRLGEGQGDTATDSAGRSPAARFVGGGITRAVPGAIADDSDGGVRLSELGWVSLGDNFDFVGKASFTIELWARPQVVDDKYRGIFTKEVGGGGTRQGYLLTVQSTAGLAFERSKDGVSGTVTAGTLTAGLYSHVVVTYDGTSLALYVNGEVVGGPTASNVELPDTTANAVAGARFSGNTPIGSAAHFKGDLDELALYDRALEPERIETHYRAAKKLAF